MPDMQCYWLIINIKFKNLINSRNVYLAYNIINMGMRVSVRGFR